MQQMLIRLAPEPSIREELGHVWFANNQLLTGRHRHQGSQSEQKSCGEDSKEKSRDTMGEALVCGICQVNCNVKRCFS